jgi:hypothetical protein
MRAAALLLLLLGCKGADPYVVSGTALVVLGETYVGTVAVMDARCAPDGGLATAACDTWRTVAAEFRAAYSPAVELLNAASLAGDPELRATAAAALARLSRTLAPYSSDGGTP